MWSHIYGYYEIRGAADYSVSSDTEKMRAILAGFPELKQTGLISYENAINYPWISLSLVKSNKGSYAVFAETWNRDFNMISVVCSKSENGKVPASQIDLLIKIAGILNWELIDEETDDNDEKLILYSPV
ncbi:hypothetical protein [Hymenobacter sp.]|uniref:hypothetical protein n=1 Tax=Hymenobacter sp. TaxID=1898978 RepID=UPI002D7EB290|nr:hypothetical protein [Hymenobacter sp.]